VTKQSGPDGLLVNSVYILPKLAIDKEMYLSLTLDRGSGCPIFVYSPCGGTSIEDVAKKDPSKIFKLPIDPINGPAVD